MAIATERKITCPVCCANAAHRYQKDSFAIAQCIDCKTIFVENPPQDTSAIYDKTYFFGDNRGGGYGSYDAEKETMRGTFEKCLDVISQYRANGSLFDIGAATGYFLALARKRGFRVSGIDISSAAAREAAKKGIDVAVGTLELVPYRTASFDVVTMFDVLEHVPTPMSLMENVSRLLPAGGVVFGSTPDSGSFYARLMGRRWHMLFPPEHLVLLNDKSLRQLFEKHGLDVLWTGRITKRFSLSYIFQTAARWLGVPLLNRVSTMLRGTRLGALAIPLDLRDNVFFLARKKSRSILVNATRKPCTRA